jgi:hypothetical protein
LPSISPASYAPEDAESPLAELLKLLVARADHHTDALAAIAAGVRRLENGRP